MAETIIAHAAHESTPGTREQRGHRLFARPSGGFKALPCFGPSNSGNDGRERAGARAGNGWGKGKECSDAGIAFVPGARSRANALIRPAFELSFP